MRKAQDNLVRVDLLFCPGNYATFRSAGLRSVTMSPCEPKIFAVDQIGQDRVWNSADANLQARSPSFISVATLTRNHARCSSVDLFGYHSGSGLTSTPQVASNSLTCMNVLPKRARHTIIHLRNPDARSGRRCSVVSTETPRLQYPWRSGVDT